jgi:flagellar basal body-associated protein FliL
MTQTPPEPQKQSPLKLNGARIVILILGVLILVYAVSAMMGGLANYQALREAATAAKTAEPAAPATP